MFVLELTCPPEEKDRLVAELWERGTAGVAEEETAGGGFRLKAYFEDGADIEALAAGFRLFGSRWGREVDRDWTEVSREQWEPLLVGERFFLAPEWRDDPTPPGRFRLVIRPGQGFGTGWHPSTRLCLAALERHVLPGSAVLDAGTGSGILSIAAVWLGAARVTACDTDPEAVEAAREWFRREPLEVALYIGSVDAARSGSADVVVANITADVLIWLAPEIARVLKRRGRAILSGMTCDEAPGVRAAFEAAGLRVGEELQEAGWLALVC